MNKDAVQHERGPRNSTIRRQMALYVKEKAEATTRVLPPSAPAPPIPTLSAASPVPITPMSQPALLSAAIHSGMLIPQRYPPELITAAYLANPEAVCETAARLLFMSVKWVKNVPAFVGLAFKDQVTLLEEGWRELFVLGAAQFLMPVDPQSLLATSPLSREDGSSSEAFNQLSSELKSLKEIIDKLKAMQVDQTEYACLKGVALFKTSIEEGRSLLDVPSIASLQDQAQLTLNKYIQTAYPTQPSRFGKLLLLLPNLKNVSCTTIEQVFFKRTIGAVSMEKIIIDMYKSPDF
ncbi:DgyrCDS8787 [Dimorphilus gyrociliatus]|nr:DgyrCDS8787 [Dimorphilus gyrociliatus]